MTGAGAELPAGVGRDDDSGQLFRIDLLQHAREVLAVCHATVGMYAGEEELGDAIADLLHLAAFSGLDVDDVLAKGRGYYTGDLEGALA